MKLWDKLLGHFYLIMTLVISVSTLLMWWPIVTRVDNFKMFLFYLTCSMLIVMGYMIDLYTDRIVKQQIYIDEHVPMIEEVEELQKKIQKLETGK